MYLTAKYVEFYCTVEQFDWRVNLKWSWRIEPPRTQATRIISTEIELSRVQIGRHRGSGNEESRNTRVISRFLRVLFLRKCSYWSEATKVGHCLLYRYIRKKGRPRGAWRLNFFFRKPCLSNVGRRATMNYAGTVWNGTRRDGTPRNRNEGNFETNCRTLVGLPVLKYFVFPLSHYATWFTDTTN